MAADGVTDTSVSGWMRRCILIGAPRQASAWRQVLSLAATEQGKSIRFLDLAPPSQHEIDDDTIYVASDPRLFSPVEGAQRVTLLIGLDHFSGLDDISEEDARIHLIEMSRHAAQAREWGRRGQLIETGTPGPLVLFQDFEAPALSLPPPGTGRRDQAAAKAMRFMTRDAKSEWDCSLFIMDTHRAPERIDHDWRDMTGPPRPLVRGPYLWAAPGQWKVKAQFLVDDDGAKQQLQIRWGPPLTPVILEVTPARSGMFEAELENRWTEADGMELTIALPHSVVSGCIAFTGCQVSQA
jgi:hypothetical protein